MCKLKEIENQDPELLVSSFSTKCMNNTAESIPRVFVSAGCVCLWAEKEYKNDSNDYVVTFVDFIGLWTQP